MWIKKMDVIECKLWKFPSQTRAERGSGYVSKGLRVSQLGLGSVCYKILLKAFDLLYPLYQH